MTRRPNTQLVERFVLPYDHAQATADTTVKLWKAARPMRIDRVMYTNPTGLAEHATAFYDVEVKKNATIIANKSTDSATSVGDDSIAADTPLDLTLTATDADLVFAIDDILSITLERGAAAATLPAGRYVIEGRYL